jgi:hypothetical protein
MLQTGSSETLIGWKPEKNHLFPSIVPNGGSVAMDSGKNAQAGPTLSRNSVIPAIQLRERKTSEN